LLSGEASEYWKKSGLKADFPIERLAQLNPGAIDLFKDHNIDLYNEPLRIAVCAQHNNGGLSADIWWESTNIKHFFPVGEVNGTHGVSRPGGTALNSGQVAAFRVSRKIAAAYKECSLDFTEARELAGQAVEDIVSLISIFTSTPPIPHCAENYRNEFRLRMNRSGALVRDPSGVEIACVEGRKQFNRFSDLRISRMRLPGLFKMRQMVLAHLCYLYSISDYIKAGGGSRGSYVIKSETGSPVHPLLGEEWQIREEEYSLRNKVQIIKWDQNSEEIRIRWIPCRSIPREDSWFETVWAEFLDKSVYMSEVERNENT
jgi:hypothetical protein